MRAKGIRKLEAYRYRGNKVMQTANRTISFYTFERKVTG
jgi:hypothetical protein